MTSNPIKILWASIKSALNPKNFSWVNFTNLMNIIAVVLMAQANDGNISMGWSLLITSIITMLLKLRQSHKELVATGKDLTTSFYVITIIGVALGAFEAFFSSGRVSEVLGDNLSLWVTIGYSVLLMYIRTGYTNQSVNTMASAKP